MFLARLPKLVYINLSAFTLNLDKDTKFKYSLDLNDKSLVKLIVAIFDSNNPALNF